MKFYPLTSASTIRAGAPPAGTARRAPGETLTRRWMECR